MIPLTDLGPGMAARVVDVLSAPARRDRLAAFGLIRGTRIRLLQRRPVLIVRIDGTELAIEVEIGREIQVRADSGV